MFINANRLTKLPTTRSNFSSHLQYRRNFSSEIENDPVRYFALVAFKYLNFPPRLCFPVDVPGVDGIRTPSVSHPMANCVIDWDVKKDKVDESIKGVIANYKGNPFLVMATPVNKPSMNEIEAGLQKNGFIRAFDVFTLKLTDLDKFRYQKNPAIEVKKIPMDKILTEFPNHVFDEAFKAEFKGLWAEVYNTKPKKGEFEVYVSYMDGIPVTVGVAFYIGDTLNLTGAGTLEKYRGKGAYRALTAERIAEAKKRGIKAVTIQSKTTTSAPILMRNGFEKMDDIHFWLWMPPQKH